MAMISQEKLDEIRNSVDIVEVISRYIPLTQKGRNYMCSCPFHNDNNPSMSVSKEKQIYTCFSCHKSGNVFGFVKDYENISFLESVKKIADYGGVNVDIKSKGENRTISSPLYDIYELSSKFYQNNLHSKDGKKAIKYLNDRELDNDTIKEFGIGVALKERNLLSKLLEKKDYDEQTLIKSGLVLKNEYGYVDMFYNRIMFPIWDINGKVVAYSGRIYDEQDISKYINSKQTEIFKKGDILYNYHRAKDECRKQDVVIIMEGFMDLLRAYKVGIKNVIATMGTAFTSSHAQLIKRMARNVIICFDGDNAGANASIACTNELLKLGVVPKIVRLEDNLDPDEYILKYGGEMFKKRIDNPINVIDFKISYFKNNRDMNSPQDVADYVNDIIKEISIIDDEILVTLTLKKVSEETGLDVTFLQEKLQKPQEKVKKETSIIKYRLYEKAEIGLLYYMLKSSEVIRIFNSQVPYLPTEKFRFLSREVLEYYKKYGKIDVASFIDYLHDDSIMRDTLSEIVSQIDLYDDYTVEQIEEYIGIIKKYNIQLELKKIKATIKETNDSGAKAIYGQKICDIMKVEEENV